MHIKRADRVIPTLNESGAVMFETAGLKSGGTVRHSVTEIMLPPGGRIAAHAHMQSEESLYVISGVIVVSIGEEERQLATGDVVAIPLGLRHEIRNISEDAARLLSISAPPWSSEDLLGEKEA